MTDPNNNENLKVQKRYEKLTYNEKTSLFSEHAGVLARSE